MSSGRYLPQGLVEGCRLVRDVAKDEVLTYDDAELPQGRLADRLRAEQYRHFRGETWLEARLEARRGARLDSQGPRKGASRPPSEPSGFGPFPAVLSLRAGNAWDFGLL
jgi:hypothetical protein